MWSEVSRVLQNPDLIVAGIESLDAQDSGALDEEISKAERQLRSVQMEEDRAIRLYVSGKITEAQLDHQRKFITERLELHRKQLDDLQARAASGAEKRATMEAVLAWAGEVGDGLDDMTPEQRKAVLQLVLDDAIIDKHNHARINLAIPVEGTCVNCVCFISMDLRATACSRLRVKRENFHTKMTSKGALGLPPSSIISRNWGLSATRPLSASSTYSRATE